MELCVSGETSGVNPVFIVEHEGGSLDENEDVCLSEWKLYE